MVLVHPTVLVYKAASSHQKTGIGSFHELNGSLGLHTSHLEPAKEIKNSTWVMDVILMNVAPSSGGKPKSIMKSCGQTKHSLSLWLSQLQ